MRLFVLKFQPFKSLKFQTLKGLKSNAKADDSNYRGPGFLKGSLAFLQSFKFVNWFFLMSRTGYWFSSSFDEISIKYAYLFYRFHNTSTSSPALFCLHRKKWHFVEFQTHFFHLFWFQIDFMINQISQFALKNLVFFTFVYNNAASTIDSRPVDSFKIASRW